MSAMMFGSIETSLESIALEVIHNRHAPYAACLDREVRGFLALERGCSNFVA
ncbi:MAG: hypothetical protein WB615_16335 [Candidatus Tumulicola sp.]